MSAQLSVTTSCVTISLVWVKEAGAASSKVSGESRALTSGEKQSRLPRTLSCCAARSNTGYKIHGWINGPIDREVAAVLAIRAAVDDDMDLLLDPVGCLPRSRMFRT